VGRVLQYPSLSPLGRIRVPSLSPSVPHINVLKRFVIPLVYILNSSPESDLAKLSTQICYSGHQILLIEAYCMCSKMSSLVAKLPISSCSPKVHELGLLLFTTRPKSLDRRFRFRVPFQLSAPASGFNFA
jgi:hypothetical protein